MKKSCTNCLSYPVCLYVDSFNKAVGHGLDLFAFNDRQALYTGIKESIAPQCNYYKEGENEL